MSASSRTPYIETFDGGSRGWVANNMEPLVVWDGVAYCHGPWYLDANHAPPGAGYLHLLMYLHTLPEHLGPYSQDNAFIAQNKSRDLRNAKLSVRVRAQIDLQGAQLMLLAQSKHPETDFPRRNFILTSQPISLTPEWSDQTITLAADPAQWTNIGRRHDLGNRYGGGTIEQTLADVNVDLIFVLFPLTIKPIEPVEDIHLAWAARDYHVDHSVLPRGIICFDTVRIDYPD